MELFNETTKRRGHLEQRRRLSARIRYLHRVYYKMAEAKPLTDADRIKMWELRARVRLLQKRLEEEFGGPLLNKGESILHTVTPLWNEDHTIYEQYEGPGTIKLIASRDLRKAEMEEVYRGLGDNRMRPGSNDREIT